MFTKEVNSLTLVSDIADEIFPRINGSFYGGDQSFVATLRALLYSRLPEDESVTMKYSNRRAQKREAELFDKKDNHYINECLRAAPVMDKDAHGKLHIHSVRSPMKEDIEAAFGFIDNSADLKKLGFKPVADLQKFLEQKKIMARFYINEERKCMVIFIENMDIKRWHLLQAMTPRYFPWYFKDAPMTEEESVIIKALTNRYAPDYENAIEDFAKKFDFRTANLRRLLRDFETAMDRNKLGETIRQIESYARQIEQYNQEIGRMFEAMNEQSVIRTGLEIKIGHYKEGEESEMMQFFVCNKGLHLVSANFDNFEFIVTTEISNYDPDMFDKLIRNHNSAFYRDYRDARTKYGNEEMSDDRIERLMKAIFAEERLKLRVCAAYRLNFNTARAYGLKNYNFENTFPGYKDFTPNQHIQYYACLGNNEAHIRKALQNRDYVGAIVACMSSAKNMNMFESNTITWFMQQVLSPNAGRFIEMPDGSILTPLDAVKWLEEEANGKEKRKEEKPNE